ncbi:MAG: hypothetical protein M1457_00045, partial [bacterium]|nr:hypothetical protein [bacterium]
MKIGQLPDGARLFDSVYDDREYNAGGAQTDVSTLYAVGKDGGIRPLNAARMENILWTETQLPPAPDSRYIKNMASHVRQNSIYLNYGMVWSPLVKAGDIENKTYEQWTQGIDWSSAPPPGVKTRSRIKDMNEYEQGLPTAVGFR